MKPPRMAECRSHWPRTFAFLILCFLRETSSDEENDEDRAFIDDRAEEYAALLPGPYVSLIIV